MRSEMDSRAQSAGGMNQSSSNLHGGIASRVNKRSALRRMKGHRHMHDNNGTYDATGRLTGASDTAPTGFGNLMSGISASVQ